MAAAILGTAALALPAGAQIATGASSVGTAETGGGDGGSSTFVASPVATSGSSGTASAGSTASNSGNTGDATSIAISNPFSASGVSGGAGNSGATASTPAATNTATLGSAVVGSNAPAVPAATNGSAAQTVSSSAGAATESAGVVPAEATDGLRAADAALATATELTAPPAFQAPAPVELPETVVPSGGIEGSFAAFTNTLVSEYSDADTMNLLVLFLGFVLAAKMARTFTRLNFYWDLRP